MINELQSKHILDYLNHLGSDLIERGNLYDISSKLKSNFCFNNNDTTILIPSSHAFLAEILYF